MYRESASNVQNSVHFRPILCTFEADSLYIWGRFSIHLRADSIDWLRGITWQNKLSLPQMYRESASNVQNSVHLRPILYTFEANSIENGQIPLTFDSNSTSDMIHIRCAKNSQGCRNQLAVLPFVVRMLRMLCLLIVLLQHENCFYCL